MIWLSNVCRLYTVGNSISNISSAIDQLQALEYLVTTLRATMPDQSFPPIFFAFKNDVRAFKKSRV